MVLVGRDRELAEVDRLLDRAADAAGDVLALIGPPGSGRTALADAAARAARDRGFEVLRASGASSRAGRLLWVQLLHDVGAPEDLAARLLDDAGPLHADRVARAVLSDRPRAIVIDDVDRSGAEGVDLLAAAAGRAGASRTAVVVTASSPLAVGRELRLGPLDEAELGDAVGAGVAPGARHALWVASSGRPGVARALAAKLAGAADDLDPMVRLALSAVARTGFLEVDVELVQLIEAALQQPVVGATRARLLARLARELLGDAPSGARRRALSDEALALARESGEASALGEVLDARLHALWDPAGAEDRLDAAAEILDLVRTSGDQAMGRRALFWRFVALIELGRVEEAESALAAFARAAEAAGDAAAMMMVTARHAMLALLRGRFDEAVPLIERVDALGRRAGVPDIDRLVGALRGGLARHRATEPPAGAVELFASYARRLPGHLFEAGAAVLLLVQGRTGEAGLELERILPQALAASGPRWVAAMADLAMVAVGTGNRDAAARLYTALEPYHGRLATYGGANLVTGTVDHHLGLLATELADLESAIRHFEDSIALAESIGALPFLAHSLEGLAAGLSARARAGDLDAASRARRRARAIAEQLGMVSFLEGLSRPADEWSLVRDDGDWVLEAGAERGRMRDTRGLHHLRALVANPGRDLSALDLAAGGPGLVAAGTGPVADGAALDAYRRRAGELDAEIDAADRAGDEQRARRAEAERAELLDQLRRMRSLGGRAREASPEAERARVNVTRTLNAAVDRIAATAPRAAAHLRASIRTGRVCRYEPAPGGPDRWHL